MATPITGDFGAFKATKKQGVTLHNMPVYPSSDVSNKAASINQEHESGKRYGAMITVSGYTKPVLYMAAGNKPTDAWIAITNDGADIVPA
ncbi:hypothetical protein IB245_11850 [Pseudomonas sp. PDM02]|uniref:hypothetical protein n=1 Tax=Pseudomonas sp. PDM02 TaxID=2769267 RepID=UPI00177BAF6F|nr:hypothetical protein [Pseudomonas sp. PDM02]MBD9612196.1 hypothetical protein [Pseudomonas sp. PDM02]